VGWVGFGWFCGWKRDGCALQAQYELCTAMRAQCALAPHHPPIQSPRQPHQTAPTPIGSEVALLKVNVERAEWDVLMGIREEHWGRIRQVALQVGARVHVCGWRLGLAGGFGGLVWCVCRLNGSEGSCSGGCERSIWWQVLMVRGSCWNHLLSCPSFTPALYNPPPTTPKVHDIDRRVAATEELLCTKGFTRVVVYKEPRFADCNLYMVYGARRVG